MWALSVLSFRLFMAQQVRYSLTEPTALHIFSSRCGTHHQSAVSWVMEILALLWNFVTDPVRLSLSSSFRTLLFALVDQTTKEKESGVFGALAKVALVVSQSHQISELDFESAQHILHSSMKQFPDLYFVFLSNDVNTFRDMVGRNNDRAMSGKLVRFSITKFRSTWSA